MSELFDFPVNGRRYDATRTVRLGDVGISGTLRLDALARFLQDVAADDAASAGLRDASWVVRRTVLELDGRPRYGERIELMTFCGGLGSRWAERRTTVVGPDCLIEASSIWVYIDGVSGRPAPLPPVFLDAYAETAGDRRASTRLVHGPRPDDLDTRPWPLRSSDFDVLGHVNNSVYWAAVEDGFDGDLPAACHIELENRTPIEPGADVTLARAGGDLWLAGAHGVYASARATGLPLPLA